MRIVRDGGVRASDLTFWKFWSYLQSTTSGISFTPGIASVFSCCLHPRRL